MKALIAIAIVLSLVTVFVVYGFYSFSKAYLKEG